jgi:hypothetical protein
MGWFFDLTRQKRKRGSLLMGIVFATGALPAFKGSEPGDIDGLYIAWRSLLAVGPDDVILLPGRESVRRFVQFLISIRKIRAEQVIWLESQAYLMEEMITEGWMRVSEMLEPYRKGTIVPYGNSVLFQKIADYFDLTVQGEVPGLVEVLDKQTLHPWLSETPRPKCLPHIGGVPGIIVLPGYIANNLEELKFAIAMLRSSGVRKFVVKQANGAGGDGIFLNVTLDEIPDCTYPVVVEQKIDIKTDERGILAPSVQYTAGQWDGTILRQVMHGNSFAGNRVWLDIPSSIKQQIESMVPKLIVAYGVCGNGGFDFLVDNQNSVWFVDPNLRLTGAHPVLWARDRLIGSNVPFCSWKIDYPGFDVFEFWKRLNGAGIALVHGSAVGVFPLLFTEEWCMLMAFGSNDETLDRLIKQANDLLGKEG